MSGHFDGKVCVVTGAVSGIGYAVSDALLRGGAVVVLADHDADRLASAAGQLAAHGDRVASAMVDVTSQQRVQRLIDDAVARHSRLDFLFNNAGVGGTLPIGDASVAVYHRGRLAVELWGGRRNTEGDPWQRDTLAMCFSTTKGVAATCAHVLADRGDLDYDERVATYWPEFAQNGKADITVRQVLSPSAGLHRLGTIIDHGSKILDWDHMTDALARAKPAYEPGTSVGYHALTFGWLVGELVRRISGIPIQKFVQTELAEPLGLDGLYIGCPPEQWYRVAPLKSLAFKTLRTPVGQFAVNQVSRGLRAVGSPVNPHRMLNTAMFRGMEDVLVDPRLLDAAVPAMNGYFNAVSLGGMYAMLAGGGQLNGVRVLSEATVRKASSIQNNQRDRVVVMTMQWRLGYHRTPVIAKQLPHAYGHFGFGGSGAWADPDHDLALAMVCNRGGGTPIGDLRILRLSQAAARAVLAAS